MSGEGWKAASRQQVLLGHLRQVLWDLFKRIVILASILYCFAKSVHRDILSDALRVGVPG